MKKFTLTLLLIFGTVSALFAQQSVREDIIKEVADMDYAYVEVSANFTADVPYDKLLAISNDQNRDKFVCKCSAERDGEDNCFKVAMEFITNNRTNTEYQMAHALRLLPGWIEKFKEELD